MNNKILNVYITTLKKVKTPAYENKSEQIKQFTLAQLSAIVSNRRIDKRYTLLALEQAELWLKMDHLLTESVKDVVRKYHNPTEPPRSDAQNARLSAKNEARYTRERAKYESSAEGQAEQRKTLDKALNISCTTRVGNDLAYSGGYIQDSKQLRRYDIKNDVGENSFSENITKGRHEKDTHGITSKVSGDINHHGRLSAYQHDKYENTIVASKGVSKKFDAKAARLPHDLMYAKLQSAYGKSHFNDEEDYDVFIVEIGKNGYDATMKMVASYIKKFCL